MPFEVGGDGMAIRGECASLDQYLVALPRRLEKTREHQMQIDRERAHGDNFARPGARHQLEAAREIDEWCSLLVARQGKALPHSPQGVFGITPPSVIQGGFVRHDEA